MYSGTTFHNKSGAIVGVHQRIDRIARRGLKKAAPKAYFPMIKDILHFEGRNGPDGIKSKSPSKDEPWHYVDPQNPSDTQLYELINDHIENLANALKGQNMSRASFEAAWLAHAIVDGLTPAHHFPLSDEIEKLWGKPKEERLTIRDKNIIRGSSRRDTVGKNWRYWGAKGVFMTHFTFELGVASSIASTRYKDFELSESEIKKAIELGFKDYYKTVVDKIFAMNMYETYYKKGWTGSLARLSREELIPLTSTAVALSWLEAIRKSQA